MLVLGVGSVGGTFLDQLADHGEEALAPHGLRPLLVGISQSRKAVVDLEGLDPSRWRELLEGGDHTSENVFASVFTGDPLVIVDCTASAEVANRYPDYLRSGAAVVTANKIPLSASLDEYRSLQRTAQAGGGLHHETTVGLLGGLGGPGGRGHGSVSVRSGLQRAGIGQCLAWNDLCPRCRDRRAGKKKTPPRSG